MEYPDGTKTWYRNGLLHREDGPAIEHPDGTKSWYLNSKCSSEKEVRALGKMKLSSTMTTDTQGNKAWRNAEGQLHREDGPAFEFPDGTKSWHRNGQYHREDGPACEYSSGTKSWYLNGKPSSEEEVRALGKMKLSSTMTVDSEGNKIWRNAEGHLHREDGPAYFSPVCKEWYLNGLLHREDGPAIIYVDGIVSWYLLGCVVNEAVVKLLKKMENNQPFD